MRAFFPTLVAAASLVVVQAAVNAATVSLIKEFEGFVDRPKPDPIGLPTVGFGHLCKQKNCAEVKFTFPLTPATAAELLQTDIKTFHPYLFTQQVLIDIGCEIAPPTRKCSAK